MGSFKYALSKMREGGVVRRTSWDARMAIMMVLPDNDYHWAESTWAGPLVDVPAALEQEDLEADDWEICGGYCP